MTRKDRLIAYLKAWPSYEFADWLYSVTGADPGEAGLERG